MDLHGRPDQVFFLVGHDPPEVKGFLQASESCLWVKSLWAQCGPNSSPRNALMAVLERLLWKINLKTKNSDWWQGVMPLSFTRELVRPFHSLLRWAFAGVFHTQNAKLGWRSGPPPLIGGTFHLFPSYPNAKHLSLNIRKYNQISADTFPFI